VGAAYGCPAILLRILAARGVVDAASLRRYLAPALDDLHEPAGMLGMAPAIDRIQRAVCKGEPILIYGDYDVDGTTATVLLKTAIERIADPALPAQVRYHIPHRLREGYGMQTSVLAAAAAAGVRLVISVDTGIRAFAEAAEARSLGLDLIVTDHHLPDGVEGVPDAFAVINPAQSGCSYPNKRLCGAGVAFKLAQGLLAAAATTPALQQHLRERMLPSFLKLVAIATIADSVELTGENRAIAWLGLRELRHPVQPGLRALMQVAKLALDQAPTAAEVGFRLGPRINAAGRMDIASEVVELFLTRDPLRAQQLAARLDQLNEERRASETAALSAIDLQLKAMRLPDGAYAPECLVLDHPEWHRGVLGILASRVVERTGRPALVLCSDGETAHGSGRSIDGYHLLDALTAVHGAAEGGLLTRFGGHAHAVGLTLPAERIGDLRRRLRQHSGDLLTRGALAAKTFYDAELGVADLHLDLARWVDRLAPFGAGNPEPLFLVRGLRLKEAPRAIKETHVCLPIHSVNGQSINAMGWSRSASSGGNGGVRRDAEADSWLGRAGKLGLRAGSSIDAIVRLRENKHPQYGGLDLELIDFALSEPALADPSACDVILPQSRQAESADYCASFAEVSRPIN
jgi:single-stranded-DNA-specific exonuclease